MEDTMSPLTRTMLPAFALAAMMSVAQAQDAQPGTQHPAGQPRMTGPGMMMDMDQMRSMMDQQGSQPGMMGNMGQMMPMRQMMMGQQGGMGMPYEHVEGRIAFLKAELKITDAQ